MTGIDVDRDETRAWLARWKEVERVVVAEARAMTPEMKLRQLESLMASADLFEWRETADDERVRALWLRLYALQR